MRQDFASWRRWLLRIVLPAAILLLLVVLVGWAGRSTLNLLFLERPAVLPAAAVGLVIWLLLGGLILVVRARIEAQVFRDRVGARTGLSPLKQPTVLARWLKRIPDPFEWLLGPVIKTAWGQRRADEWRLAGYGHRASRYLLILFGSSALAGLAGAQLSGLVLATALAAVAPLAPYRWVAGRAQEQLRLFSEQVPPALDAIAAGISAGLSFQQSIRFAIDELPAPMAESLTVVDRRILLGHPVDQVLQRWSKSKADEGLSLAVDGILLQRQMGGDLVEMLQRTAQVARERIELQREVQAVTAQGRLSGWVIGGLVPISAALLLASNPRYIDVLFNTLLGQALLVVALALQLMGWLVISRLIRVAY